MPDSPSMPDSPAPHPASPPASPEDPTESTPGNRQQELAEDRTRIAYQRTRLAEERTYSAWLRTGLAAAASGMAIAKLMPDSDPAWLVKTIALLFILAGAAMFSLAFWAYRDAWKRIRDEAPHGGIPLWILAILSLTLLVGAAAGMFLVFV